jgi:hypothetical protein
MQIKEIGDGKGELIGLNEARKLLEALPGKFHS